MGLGEKKLKWRERGWRGNKSDCIGNRDFKAGSFGRFGGEGCDLAKGKRGTSACRVADTGEKKGLPGEKAGGESKARRAEPQKKGSLILLMRE